MAVTFFAYPDPAVWWQILLYHVAVAWGAFIIGVFGVGGGAFFLPSMLLLPGINVPVAIGTTYLGVLPMSLSRNYQLHLHGRLNWRGALSLMVGAVPGAFAAQALLPHLPEAASALLVSALVLFAGIQTQKKVMGEYLSKRRAAAKAEAREEAAMAANAVPAATASCDVETPAATGAAVAEAGPANAASPAPVAPAAGAPPTAAAASEEAAEEERSPEAEAIPGSHGDTEALGQQASDACAAKVQAQATTGASSVSSLNSISATPATWTEAMCSRGALYKFLIGGVASFLSSLTGTGGPLILFPVWLLIDPNVRMKELVGYGNCFALSLASMSMAGALLFASLDVGLASTTAVVAMVSCLIGGQLQERLGDSVLKLCVGGLLMVIAVVLAVNTVRGLVEANS